MRLLWNEYCEAFHLNGEIPYLYSQFCRYRDIAESMCKQQKQPCGYHANRENLWRWTGPNVILSIWPSPLRFARRACVVCAWSHVSFRCTSVNGDRIQFTSFVDAYLHFSTIETRPERLKRKPPVMARNSEVSGTNIRSGW